MLAKVFKTNYKLIDICIDEEKCENFFNLVKLYIKLKLSWSKINLRFFMIFKYNDEE
jgi:hypothetical protein